MERNKDKRFTQKKEAGRPAGSPNQGNKPLIYKDSGRISEGYKETLKALVSITGKNKTVIKHEAMQLYAARHVKEAAHIYWLNKII